MSYPVCRAYQSQWCSAARGAERNSSHVGLLQVNAAQAHVSPPLVDLSPCTTGVERVRLRVRAQAQLGKVERNLPVSVF